MQQPLTNFERETEDEDTSNQIAESKRESDQIASDQGEFARNMKALKGSSEEKALLQALCRAVRCPGEPTGGAAQRKLHLSRTAKCRAVRTGSHDYECECGRDLLDVGLDRVEDDSGR